MFPNRYAVSSRQAGFSLIELMVVMSVIAILAATCIPIMRTFAERARVSAGVTAGRCISNSFAAFAAASPGNTYPVVNDYTELATVATANGCPMPFFGNPDFNPPVGFNSMFCYFQDPVTGTIFIVPCDPGTTFDYRLALSVPGVTETFIEVDSIMGVRARPVP